MYRYLIRKNPSILLYILISPLRAVSNVACAGALAVAVDYANNGELNNAWKYAVFFGAYILLDMLIDVADQAIRLRVTEQTMVQLRTDVYHKLSRMCYLHFFQHNSADYLSNLTTDVEILRKSFFSTLLAMYSDFLRCITAIALLIYLSPMLGIFVLVTSLLQTLIPIIYSKKLEQSGAQHSNAQELHMKVLKENLSAFLPAKTFHVEDKLEHNYIATLSNTEEKLRKMRFLKEWTSSLSFVFNQIAHLGVFLLGAILSIKGLIDIAEVVAASELIVYISYPILWLNGEISELRTSKVPIQKLTAILEEPGDLGGSEHLHHASGKIVVRDLHFSYRDRPVLSGICFTFESGKKYLITGPSGCGKSTLLSLISGLRDDYTGSIMLDDTEIRNLSRQSLTRFLCIINQEPFLFDDTLYNNVCLYEPIDENSVINVLQRVGLGSFISNLPQGVHTSLGEGAVNMSGGEKQRVVIARALVRKTPILLLDESTSHLDPHTTSEIESLVLSLRDVTVLLVSHNASDNAKKAFDQVLEMSNGILNIQKDSALPNNQ